MSPTYSPANIPRATKFYSLFFVGHLQQVSQMFTLGAL